MRSPSGDVRPGKKRYEGKQSLSHKRMILEKEIRVEVERQKRIMREAKGSSS